jgi:hypothetical protein
MVPLALAADKAAIEQAPDMGTSSRAALAMGFPTTHDDAHRPLAVNTHKIAVALARDADANGPLRFREIKQLSHNSLLSNLCSIIAGA